MATRAASGKALNDLASKLPGLIGGSADLAGSTKTDIDGSDHFGAKSPAGRNIYFGVREHGMGAAVNGMAIHGGVRPYGGTFLVFSDYMRGSVRLSAVMGAPSIWIWTHDSVFLGEDGPTHQPVEHLMALRAIPNLWVFRPADATETAEAWEMVANRTDGPCALVLTRQGVPILDRVGSERGVARGGYVLRGGDDMVLVATGSEVSLALGAAELLAERGTSARVVSLPCWEVFLDEDEAYRDEVLGEGLPIASIEAGVTSGWQRITGRSGLNLGIDRFGASAPYKVIADHIGFTPEGVAERGRGLAGRRQLRSTCHRADSRARSRHVGCGSGRLRRGGGMVAGRGCGASSGWRAALPCYSACLPRSSVPGRSPLQAVCWLRAGSLLPRSR